jgi:hypothetical protein
MKQPCLALTLILSACGQSSDRKPADNAASTVAIGPAANAIEEADPFNRVENVALPDDRAPLDEPKAPIDPKTTDAAGQVVQSFGALIEQKRWGEAEALWDDAGAARAFTVSLKKNRETHLEIGKPGDPDGAAGSIYVTVPIILYGKNAAGSDFRRGADATLRRVNDVPGSTPAQRRWHFERVDLK